MAMGQDDNDDEGSDPLPLFESTDAVTTTAILEQQELVELPANSSTALHSVSPNHRGHHGDHQGLHQRRRRQGNSIERKESIRDFRSHVLDDSFLPMPIRFTMVETAKLYQNHPTIFGTSTVVSSTPSSASYLMPGTHKHLGGAYDPTDGCIYGVPANSRSVLCLYPIFGSENNNNNNKNNHNNHILGQKKDDCTVVTHYAMKSIPLPRCVADQRMKWLRGIFAHGYMWAIPSWADSVLCVDVDAYWGRQQRQQQRNDESINTSEDGGFVQLLPLPLEHTEMMCIKGSHLQQQRQQTNTPSSLFLEWQWHGAGINHDKTAIFCIPSNAKAVLKVDLITKKTSLIPIDYDPDQYPTFSLDLTNKWYGGIVGRDNCVYGIPYRASAILRIDCDRNTATMVGPDYGCGHYYWHGGIQVHGKIYAHPSHANTVLVIDTNPDRIQNSSLTYELPIHRAVDDTNPTRTYKWLGGSLGLDGNIYCPACDTSAVLKIDPVTEHCSTFGFAGVLKNKWQGGVLARDGCVYCIPASGVHVLRILTDPHQVNAIQLLGQLPPHKDKWQGGHVGQDGSLYFIPENGYRVLKITPPMQPPQLINGELPKDDVRLEFL